MTTLADEINDNFEENFYEELSEEVDKQALKQDVAALYQAGQEESLRDGPHLSDYIGRSLCLRKLVFTHLYKRHLVFHEQRTAAIFENGVAIHKRWQRKFERAGVALSIEKQHVELFWKILFTPDAIIDFRGKPTIVEIKGYNPTEFMKLAWKGKLPTDAILQANMYMWWTGIHQALIIVEDKGYTDFKPWLIFYDKSLVTPYIPLFDKVAALVGIHLKDQRLPPRLDECLTPDMETPKKCDCCVTCFAKQEERITLRRPQVWGGEQHEPAS